MVSDHGARAEPIRLGRELRAETKFELPKLRGGPCSAADCHTLGRPYNLFCKIKVSLCTTKVNLVQTCLPSVWQSAAQ